jgi:hypothetical protein
VPGRAPTEEKERKRAEHDAGGEHEKAPAHDSTVAPLPVRSRTAPDASGARNAMVVPSVV